MWGESNFWDHIGCQISDGNMANVKQSELSAGGRWKVSWEFDVDSENRELGIYTSN